MFLPTVLSLLQAGGPTPPPLAHPNEELVSRYYGMRSDDRGELVLRAIGGDGRELTLGVERPIFGSGRALALVSPPRSGQQSVRLLDTALQTRAEFTIPEQRTLVLSERSLVVHRRSDHSAGTAFELEFRDERGVVRMLHKEENRVLLEVDALADGGWAALSVDREGSRGVHRFDGMGQLLWNADYGLSASPIVSASPIDGRTAIGTLTSLLQSQLELRDASGQVLSSLEVPSFRSCVFAPDGETLALLGGATLSLVEADGHLAWSRTLAVPFLLGLSVAFSSDGRSLCALVGSAGDDPAPPAVLEFEVASSAPRSRRRIPSQAGSLPVVLELFQDTVGVWQLATPRGLRSLGF